MKTINKINGESKVRISHQLYSNNYRACHYQGEENDQTFFQAKYFKTIAGAERWANKVLA